MLPDNLTPGELLLEAGYRQCLHCGRLMKDRISSRRLTEDERDTFSPCAALGDVCSDCARTPSTTPLVQCCRCGRVCDSVASRPTVDSSAGSAAPKPSGIGRA